MRAKWRKKRVRRLKRKRRKTRARRYVLHVPIDMSEIRSGIPSPISMFCSHNHNMSIDPLIPSFIQFYTLHIPHQIEKPKKLITAPPQTASKPPPLNRPRNPNDPKPPPLNLAKAPSNPTPLHPKTPDQSPHNEKKKKNPSLFTNPPWKS